MNSPIFVLTAILVLSIGMTPAFATITGEVQNTSSLTLNGAWVNAEATDSFVHTTQPNSGDYTISNPASSGNTVSASQYFYERDSQTSISDGATNVDFSLSTLSKETLEYVIYVDGVSTTTMRGHINNAEDYFQIEHSIDFLEDASSSWDINGNYDCADALDELESDADWDTASANSDILIGFTDHQLTNNGDDVNACTRGPYGSTASPVIVVGDGSSDFPRTIMHELTHDYDIGHDTSSCTSQIPGIMAFGGTGGAPCGSQYIKNWTPSQDTDMENRRTWY